MQRKPLTNSTSIYDNSPESRNRRNVPQYNKSYIWQTHSKHYSQRLSLSPAPSHWIILAAHYSGLHLNVPSSGKSSLTIFSLKLHQVWRDSQLCVPRASFTDFIAFASFDRLSLPLDCSLLEGLDCFDCSGIPRVPDSKYCQKMPSLEKKMLGFNCSSCGIETDFFSYFLISISCPNLWICCFYLW